MCDPVSVAIGAVGGLVASKVLTPKVPTSSTVPTTDPAAERAAAEASAQQSANQRLAEDQRRRRGQGSLMAQGAPSPTLGDTTAAPADAQSPLSSFGSSRNGIGAALRTTLMSTGASPAAAGPSPLSGTGGSRAGGGTVRYPNTMAL